MQIKKQSNGKYQIVANVLCDDGSYHTLRVANYDTKNDAKKDYPNQVVLFKERIKNKIALKKANEQYDFNSNRFQCVCDEYLYNYSLKNRKSSLNRLTSIFKLRIYPAFNMEDSVDKIFTEPTMQRWKKYLLCLPISKVEVNKDLNVMKSIVDRAIKRGKVTNVAEANKCTLALETIRIDEPTNKKVDFWTAEEYFKFVSAFEEGSFYRVLFDTFFYCGLRMGELRGLQWKHIDWGNRTIRIEQQANDKLGTGKNEITPPKTKNAYRTIDLNDEFYNELHRFYYSANMRGYADDFVFGIKNPVTPISSSLISQVFIRTIERTGVKKIRIHDLRHTHASLMIHLGANPKFLMTRMGHASYDETITTYGHLWKDDSKNIVSKLDKLN